MTQEEERLEDLSLNAKITDEELVNQLPPDYNDNFADIVYTVCRGYAVGKWGIEQNTDKLINLADRGFLIAQLYIIDGYNEGIYNLPADTTKAEELKKKWNILEID